MSQSERVCDACEEPLERPAHRVHAGVHYCQRCYCREFKRRLCVGCGMFKRLLRSEERPHCQACLAALPCVRCKRVGRSVGLMTEYGPACDSCRVYFVEPQPCEACGTLSQRMSRAVMGGTEKRVCPRCATKHHRTCAECRRSRSCEPGMDGKWRCKACVDLGSVPCQTCSKLMPAGFGKRCSGCYWRERGDRSSGQLVELLSTRRVREAFLAFAAWLLEDEKGIERRTRRLPEHAQFFVSLDQLADEPWTGEFLLKNFTTALLRKYELPVKWLESRSGIAHSEEDKRDAADLRRVREAVAQLPAGTLARQVANAFAIELINRHTAGELSAKSVRMALRPAISLLEEEDPEGNRLPGQAALGAYLGQVPGQRAALSTFLGFLRAKHSLDLRLPPKPSALAVRKVLEKQIAAMVQDQRPIDKRWIVIALRYFHHLSAAEARAIHAAASSVDTTEGVELTLNDSVYWVPKPPALTSVGSPAG